MPKDCPKCRLVNPSEAQRCDCGWDFVTGQQERSYIVPKRVAVGLGLGIAGVFVVKILIEVAATMVEMLLSL
jgi:hypothetical protein